MGLNLLVLKYLLNHSLAKDWSSVQGLRLLKSCVSCLDFSVQHPAFEGLFTARTEGWISFQKTSGQCIVTPAKEVLPPCRKHQESPEHCSPSTSNLLVGSQESSKHSELSRVKLTSVNFGFEMDIKHWKLLFLHVCMNVEHWCGNLLIQFQVLEHCSGKGHWTMVRCFQASFLNVRRSHSFLGQAGVHRQWFSLLKHSSCFLHTACHWRAGLCVCAMKWMVQHLLMSVPFSSASVLKNWESLSSGHGCAVVVLP